MKITLELVLVMLMASLVWSCGSHSDSNDTTTNANVLKKYTIVLEGDYASSANVMVFEYTKDGDRFHQNEFSIKNGERKTFTAQKEAYKIKVYAEMWPFTSVKGWVDLVYILSEEETKTISLNDHTKFSRIEP